jgi:hypothetical protein
VRRAAWKLPGTDEDCPTIAAQDVSVRLICAWQLDTESATRIAGLAAHLVQHAQLTVRAVRIDLIALLTERLVAVAVIPASTRAASEVGVPTDLPVAADVLDCVQTPDGRPLLYATINLTETPVPDAPAPSEPQSHDTPAAPLPVRVRTTTRPPEAPPLSLFWLTAREADQHETP